MISENKSVDLEEINGSTCLVCRFPEHLDSRTAQAMIKRIMPILAGQPAPLPFVWDCQKMTGYDREARDLWQAMLQSQSASFTTIRLVTKSATIRLGALAISMFTSFDVKTCKTWEELVIG